jgi:hypothetical protein
MNEYEILGELHNIIDIETNKKISAWIDSHNVNYYLVYPLAAIELGSISQPPENIDNLFKRCVASYVYSKAKESGKEIYLKKFNTPGLRKYIKSYEDELIPLYQNYRFSREINDINPFSKPRLVQESEHRYKLTTSLVADVYNEEQFYFEGEDDLQSFELEKKQVLNLHLKFWNKIVLDQSKIENLQNTVDQDLYQECIKIVEKDLNKWDSKVRSAVFDNPKQISKVISFFYYHAMLKSISIRMDMEYKEDFINNGKGCIIMFEKEKCLKDIVDISCVSYSKVATIVDYLINDGKMNLLEFPLFEVEDKIITIPSAILVNDWQFAIINGHYIKNIQIINREKTISTVTEGRLEKTLQGVPNIAVAKTKPYSFIDENGENQCSDIDYAIYDMTRNLLLIIEAKWIDKHYKDEIDKRYGMILQTLNNIHTKQIMKHKIYLSNKSNIDILFEEDSRYNKNMEKPEIYYLAVDKRNQMHIAEKHMVSEYMLIYFLKKYIVNNQLNLGEMWKEISSLETKVEYITISDDYYEIPVKEEVVLVEKNDLCWDK